MRVCIALSVFAVGVEVRETTNSVAQKVCLEALAVYCNASWSSNALGLVDFCIADLGLNTWIGLSKLVCLMYD